MMGRALIASVLSLWLPKCRPFRVCGLGRLLHERCICGWGGVSFGAARHRYKQVCTGLRGDCPPDLYKSHDDLVHRGNLPGRQRRSPTRTASATGRVLFRNGQLIDPNTGGAIYEYTIGRLTLLLRQRPDCNQVRHDALTKTTAFGVFVVYSQPARNGTNCGSGKQSAAPVCNASVAEPSCVDSQDLKDHWSLICRRLPGAGLRRRGRHRGRPDLHRLLRGLRADMQQTADFAKTVEPRQSAPDLRSPCVAAPTFASPQIDGLAVRPWPAQALRRRRACHQQRQGRQHNMHPRADAGADERRSLRRTGRSLRAVSESKRVFTLAATFAVRSSDATASAIFKPGFAAARPSTPSRAAAFLLSDLVADDVGERLRHARARLRREQLRRLEEMRAAAGGVLDRDGGRSIATLARAASRSPASCFYHQPIPSLSSTRYRPRPTRDAVRLISTGGLFGSAHCARPCTVLTPCLWYKTAKFCHGVGEEGS